MAMQQQRQPQYHGRSFCGLRFASAAGPCTTVGTRIEPKQQWKVRMHGAFSIPRKTLGLRPTDQSCHHEKKVTGVQEEGVVFSALASETDRLQNESQ